MLIFTDGSNKYQSKDSRHIILTEDQVIAEHLVEILVQYVTHLLSNIIRIDLGLDILKEIIITLVPKKEKDNTESVTSIIGKVLEFIIYKTINIGQPARPYAKRIYKGNLTKQ